jgi:hypothetical protein
MRSLVTTVTHDHWLDGTIDERGREAVDFANTHGAAMAQAHYLQRDAERQAQAALGVAAIIAPRTASVEVVTPRRIQDGTLRSPVMPQEPRIVRPNDEWIRLPWGTAHPFAHLVAQSGRIPWSDDEVIYYILFTLTLLLIFFCNVYSIDTLGLRWSTSVFMNIMALFRPTHLLFRKSCAAFVLIPKQCLFSP